MTTLNVRDYGARGDGRTDDTDAIQAAIDDATDGDTVYLPEPEKHYKVSKGSSHPIITISGDNANPFTLRGDGDGTVIKVSDDSPGDWGIVRITDPEGFDCDVRDLVFDGNKEHQSNGTAFRFRDNGATDTGNILVEDVEIRNCPQNGWSVQYGGVTLNRTTSHGHGGHGGGVATDRSGQHDPPMKITNSHFYNNASDYSGRYEWDFSGGKGIMEDCVLENNQGNGPTKTSSGSIDFTYRRVRMQNDSAPRAYLHTGDANADITFEDVIWDNVGGFVHFRSGQNYHFKGDVIMTRSGSNAGRGRQIRITEDTTLDSDSNSVLYMNNNENANGLIDCDTSAHAIVESLQTTGNADDEILDRTGNLSINARGSTLKSNIDTVPTADEVGAWSAGGDDVESDGEPEESDEPDNDGSSFENWTPRWDSDENDWRVIQGGEFAGGHALAYEHEGGGPSRRAISWDVVGEPSDVETLDTFRIPRANPDDGRGYHARVQLRCGSSNGEERGYILECETARDVFRIIKYSQDGMSTLRRFGTAEEDTVYNRRFRAEGDTLQAKVWQKGTAEPDDWDVEITDTDHTSGWVGLGSFDTEAVRTDVFSVATNGDSAMLTESGSHPFVSWHSPENGGTVGGSVPIRIDAGVDGDSDENLTVEYRVDGGAWSTASLDAETERYEDEWDSTAVSDGDVTLEARAADSNGRSDEESLSLVVDNRPVVETTGATDVTTESATINGYLRDIGGADEVDVGFEWKQSSVDEWSQTGAQTLDAGGEFTAEVSGLDSETRYEFRAVAAYDGNRIDGETVGFETTETEDVSGGPTIETFEVTDRTEAEWTRFDVDWVVTDDDRNLDTVITTLRYGGRTVAAESTSVTGNRASFTHTMRVRGEVDEVKLLVNDVSNETDSERVSV